MILNAAVALADAEGLSAVTMRRVASSLGVEAMSLYHHVPSKAALLEGIVEAVLAEAEAEGELGRLEGTGPDEWRFLVRERCLVSREVMMRHPWAPSLMVSGLSVPLGALARYEAVLAVFVGGGLSYHLAHRALHALGSMILGFVQEPFSPSAGQADGADNPGQSDSFATLMPHLAAMVEAEVHTSHDPTLGWCDSQAEFEFTLDLLLDGLARLNAAEQHAETLSETAP
ncbi:TetR/AcrR family transcriptional regulator [Nesterenkonia sp. YGD6]|uniref:TetR/AcrR family transcriptional regulator n=1 Tax=Nesterenkonia sp. YGD6 TaxID=2901231 RepID=UPI001F4D2EDD|nr:TetR/AcrR family transcriptional regulator [Nesterenkonia sp. YGD6]